MSETSRPALVLVPHGSRDPRALATARALAGLVRAARPGLDVRLGHIELNEPLLADTLGALGGTPAVLVPLLLGRGHHVKRDIPHTVAAHATGPVRLAPALGPHPLLVRALHRRLVEAGWPGTAGAVTARHGVVLAASGSRDPDGAVDTRRTAAALSARLGVPVVPAYASAAPSVADAAAALAARGRTEVAVASYFTAPGRFHTETAEAAPGIVAAPLGAHPDVVRLVLLRHDEAAATAAQPRPALAAA
ncbi:CbiX/SirB N-terminal domain-containing protein [Streptomyces sp. NPDC002734]|uniref:sirohydrochlorin chelatase n=1 Tax=Streptomyces sp. NPDC002734 TaxID=3154426 RepID=UPI003317F9EA